MRRVIIFIAAWLTAFVVLAQQRNPAPEAPSQKPESLCAVEGVVVDAETGAPVFRAEVYLYNSGSESHLVTTEANGRFIFRNVLPGNYQLAARARGYVLQVWGHRPGWVGGQEIRLANGVHLYHMQIRLTPAGVIRGTVRDVDGAPVMDVWVSVYSRMWFRDRAMLEKAGEARTDDRGRFRIYSLYPGKYLVMADYRQEKDEDAQTYVPSYYPGTADPDQASWVEVRPGQEIPDVDIDLVMVPGVCVSGRVTNFVPAGNNEEAMVKLLPIRSQLQYEEFLAHYPRAIADMKGVFRICGVAAGDYFASAIGGEGENFKAAPGSRFSIRT